MKVLLSAYACEPHVGSEPGVGWHWAREIALLGHDVTVITRANNRESLESEMMRQPIKGLKFYFYDLPSRLKFWKKGARGIRLYYLLWQWGAYRFALKKHKAEPFDVVHHITFGVFRQPSFMGRLGIPFLLGPLGGGEQVPSALRKTLPYSARFKESMRDLMNGLAAYDPTVRSMFTQADMIFCKTAETVDYIAKKSRRKCSVRGEIGIGEGWLQLPSGETPKCVFLVVARLIAWKGVHLAIEAFAMAQSKYPELRLMIVGKGPDREWLMQRAAELGVENHIEWVSGVPQQQLQAIYAHKLALVFPSLHDSSGNVILEAAGSGLPTICLDIGGPAVVVNEGCGVKVPALSCSYREIIQHLADAMIRLYIDPDARAALSEGAFEMARQSTWKNAVLGLDFYH